MRMIKRVVMVAVMVLMAKPMLADDQDNGQIGLDIADDKVEILKVAIESGQLDPNNLPNGSLMSPLGLAVENGSHKCVDYLLSLPSVNVNDSYFAIYMGGEGVKSNQNALYTAALNGDVEVAEKLLDRGAEADYLSEEFTLGGNFSSITTTLIAAVRNFEQTPKALEVVQRIADKTKQVNRMFNYNRTAYEKTLLMTPESLLYRLIKESEYNNLYYTSVIKSLLDRGAKGDIYFVPPAGLDAAVTQYLSGESLAAYKAAQKYVYSSPMLIAAQVGDDELMSHMIDKCHVPFERYGDKGALVFANCKTAGCMQVMLDHGVDVNVVHPAAGYPVLFMTLSSDNLDAFEFLLSKGVDPNLEVGGINVLNSIRGLPKKRQKKVLEIMAKYQ